MKYELLKKLVCVCYYVLTDYGLWQIMSVVCLKITRSNMDGLNKSPPLKMVCLIGLHNFIQK